MSADLIERLRSPFNACCHRETCAATADRVAELLAACKELLAACIEEYGDPSDGAADENVGWTLGDGDRAVPTKFKYGHMQRVAAAIAKAERTP